MSNTTSKEHQELWQRYQSLLHAIQTGVAYLMQYEPAIIDLKHMRVGVTSAQLDSAATVSLLIKKGVFTQEEHLNELVKLCEREVELFKNNLSKILGCKVELG
jgi:hypothetical protein